MKKVSQAFNGRTEKVLLTVERVSQMVYLVPFVPELG